MKQPADVSAVHEAKATASARGEPVPRRAPSHAAVRWFVVAAMLGLGASACALDAEKLSLSDTNPRFIQGNYAIPDAANQALLEGTLLVGPDGCLAVTDSEGRTVVPAFPLETVVVDGGTPGIAIADREFPFGQKAAFAGGYTDLEPAERSLVAPCSEANEIFYIQGLIEAFSN
ncbi:hypothetical protein ACIGB6_07190 [Paeniglutamicibacter gangotriensis]|uniref:hypothetical protein n=1 Tax=Paeniglutamicibacter gangotriensis TaxID=254787 RepID=UPI0037C98B3F